MSTPGAQKSTVRFSSSLNSNSADTLQAITPSRGRQMLGFARRPGGALAARLRLQGAASPDGAGPNCG